MGKVTNTVTIYHNPQCSKSREAMSLLESKGIETDVIEYLKEAPNEAELRRIISMLGSPPSSLVRTREKEFQDAPFDLNSVDEIVKNLGKKPRLIERPIIIRGEKAVIARPVELLETFLK